MSRPDARSPRKRLLRTRAGFGIDGMGFRSGSERTQF